MMSLPFFFAFAALLSIWRGKRALAFGFLFVTLALLLVLFRLHATDSLELSL